MKDRPDVTKLWSIDALSTSDSPEIKVNQTHFYELNLAMFGHRPFGTDAEAQLTSENTF